MLLAMSFHPNLHMILTPLLSCYYFILFPPLISFAPCTINPSQPQLRYVMVAGESSRIGRDSESNKLFTVSTECSDNSSSGGASRDFHIAPAH